MSLAGKTLFITGASRGIGLAIALRAARDGANIAIAAKTAEPHPKLVRHHLHRRRRDRARRRQGAAARRRRARRSDGEGRARPRRRRNSAASISSSTMPARFRSRRRRRHRHEALRPDAADQCARHVRGVEMGDSLSGEGRQPAHPDDLAAARHEGEMVRAAHRLFDGEIRHEPRGARARRRVAAARHRSQRAVAAHASSPPPRCKICSAAKR